MSLVNNLKEILMGNPGERIARGLHARPLMREYLEAQDAALRTIFSQLEALDPELRESVGACANRLFETLEEAGKITPGQEEIYRELCRRNARRTIFEFTSGLQDEVGGKYARFWEEEMQQLGVLEEFRRRYVVGGKSRFVGDLAPEKPYFNE